MIRGPNVDEDDKVHDRVRAVRQRTSRVQSILPSRPACLPACGSSARASLHAPRSTPATHMLPAKTLAHTVPSHRCTGNNRSCDKSCSCPAAPPIPSRPASRAGQTLSQLPLVVALPFQRVPPPCHARPVPPRAFGQWSLSKADTSRPAASPQPVDLSGIGVACTHGGYD